MKEPIECSICLSEISCDKHLNLNNCDHYFHRKCIKQWVFSYDNNSCPLCRKEIDPCQFIVFFWFTIIDPIDKFIKYHLSKRNNNKKIDYNRLRYIYTF